MRLKARLGVRSQVVVPKAVRTTLGLKPGDAFAFVIEEGEVRIVAVAQGDDPFATFGEWASDADAKDYAKLR
jgi:antitoxin PrlF